MSAVAHSHKKTYINVFIWLTILTVVEVFVPEIKSLSSFSKGIALIVLASVKAFLVAYYFMHLNEETRWLKFIAAIPLVAIVYTVVLCLESYYR